MKADFQLICLSAKQHNQPTSLYSESGELISDTAFVFESGSADLGFCGTESYRDYALANVNSGVTNVRTVQLLSMEEHRMEDTSVIQCCLVPMKRYLTDQFTGELQRNSNLKSDSDVIFDVELIFKRM